MKQDPPAPSQAPQDPSSSRGATTPSAASDPIPAYITQGFADLHHRLDMQVTMLVAQDRHILELTQRVDTLLDLLRAQSGAPQPPPNA